MSTSRITSMGRCIYPGLLKKSSSLRFNNPAFGLAGLSLLSLDFDFQDPLRFPTFVHLSASHICFYSYFPHFSIFSIPLLSSLSHQLSSLTILPIILNSYITFQFPSFSTTNFQSHNSNPVSNFLYLSVSHVLSLFSLHFSTVPSPLFFLYRINYPAS